MNACGKHAYPDKKAAQSAANVRRHRSDSRRRGKVKHLRAYSCPTCGGWHLTHRRHFTLYND